MSGCRLPTFDEIPRLQAGVGRDEEEFIRLSLLPPDDTALRAAAFKLFIAGETYGNQLPHDGRVTLEQLRELRVGLSEAHAQTPGGIAWKLSEVMSVLAIRIEEEDGKWEWWYHLLNSAMTDAIELERARQAAGGAS